MKLLKPKFWQQKNIISYFLLPFSFITYFINLYKSFLSKKNFHIKTICIGNINIGGTGKTSLAIELNKIFRKRYKTIFVKKKYKNQTDEISLLKENGKIISEKSRISSLLKAENKKFKVALLDDGLQQKNINYDLKIVCFNSAEGFGNHFLLPAGPLRESKSELKNYDIAFLNGQKKNQKLYSLIKSINKNIKIFEGKYKPTNLKSFNRKKNYFMFCGIGNPLEFENTLKKYKFKVLDKNIYPDHYKIKFDELKSMKLNAKKRGLILITTEKDYLRIDKKNRKNITFLKTSLKINKIKNLKNLLLSKI